MHCLKTSIQLLALNSQLKRCHSRQEVLLRHKSGIRRAKNVSELSHQRTIASQSAHLSCTILRKTRLFSLLRSGLMKWKSMQSQRLWSCLLGISWISARHTPVKGRWHESSQLISQPKMGFCLWRLVPSKTWMLEIVSSTSFKRSTRCKTLKTSIIDDSKMVTSGRQANPLFLQILL